MTIFEPMLAATLDAEGQLTRWPYLASPKLDGVRCVVKDSCAYSRNLKPIRNGHIQDLLSVRRLNNLDGELVVGAPHGGDVFNRTQSGVMRLEGTPRFTFYVFDDFTSPVRDFNYRLGCAEDRIDDFNEVYVSHVEHTLVHNLADLQQYERIVLEQGYEGVMLRAPAAPYKFGRATAKEGFMWKLKRFTDGEAVVLRIEEGSHNENTAERDELGRTKRSTAKAGQVKSGLLGTLISQDVRTGAEMRISPGRLTREQREYYMKHPKELVGKLINYRSFEYGVKDAPRFANFQSFRDPATLSRAPATV